MTMTHCDAFEGQTTAAGWQSNLQSRSEGSLSSDCCRARADTATRGVFPKHYTSIPRPRRQTELLLCVLIMISQSLHTGVWISHGFADKAEFSTGFQSLTRWSRRAVIWPRWLAEKRPTLPHTRLTGAVNGQGRSRHTRLCIAVICLWSLMLKHLKRCYNISMKSY